MDIKFNAWDKFEKRMLLWNELCMDGQLLADIILNNTRYVPLQFTGMLDKNGKEFYLHDNYNSEGSDNNSVYTIYFVNGAFTGGINPTLTGPLGWDYDEDASDAVENTDFTDQMIKVGNIYEGLKIDL